MEHALESHLAEEDANDPGSPSHYQENSAAYGPLSQRQVSRSVGEAEMMELKAMTADFSDTSSDAEDTDAGGFWVQLLAGAAWPCLGSDFGGGSFLLQGCRG